MGYVYGVLFVFLGVGGGDVGIVWMCVMLLCLKWSYDCVGWGCYFSWN